jgi:hypothetical protein
VRVDASALNVTSSIGTTLVVFFSRKEEAQKASQGKVIKTRLVSGQRKRTESKHYCEGRLFWCTGALEDFRMPSKGLDASDSPNGNEDTNKPPLAEPTNDDLGARAASRTMPAKRRNRSKRKTTKSSRQRSSATAAFPKDSLAKCLRIPQAILEQNAGKDCKDREAAGFAKLNYAGEIGVEISSAIKFGLLAGC